VVKSLRDRGFNNYLRAVFLYTFEFVPVWYPFSSFFSQMVLFQPFKIIGVYNEANRLADQLLRLVITEYFKESLIYVDVFLAACYTYTVI